MSRRKTDRIESRGTGWKWPAFVAAGVLIAAAAALLLMQPGDDEVGRTGRPPVMVVPGTIDFGVVPDGEVEMRTARVRNVGSRPLSILSARASCACTSPELSEREIAPGGEINMRVRFDSTRSRTDSVTISIAFSGYDQLVQVPVTAQVISAGAL